MNKKVFISKSFKETQGLGEKFARSHPFGLSSQGRRLARLQGETLIIALYGDLGSGKTTFVQGMAEGLGIKRRIISPTFIIIRSYKLKSQSANLKTTSQNSKFFYHIDLYRIHDKKSTEGLGIEEIINNPENIVVIEWAEKMGDLLPKKKWDVRLEYLGEDKRRITIEKFEALNPKSETNSNGQNTKFETF